MPALSGLATTYGLPNYAGELLLVSPTDTPFLSAIGGLNANGDLVVTSTRFEWQTVDLAAAAQPAIVEGADPTFEERTRANVSNLVQIFQYGIKVTYSKQAAYNQLASLGNGQANPVANELDFQVNLKLMTAAKDINYSFINGAYQAPSDNTTGRKTRGLLAAISTHASSQLEAGQSFTAAAATDALTANAHGYAAGDAVRLTGTLTGATGLAVDTTYYVRDVATNTFKLAATKGGAAIDITADGSGTVQKMPVLTEDALMGVLQNVYTARGINAAFEPTLIVGAAQKRRLSKIFITDKGFQEQSRNVGGVNVQRIESDFGPMNVMLDRDVPADTVAFCHLGMCMPKFLLIPEKGFLFVEPLAKTGSYESYQLYGEVGLQYGDQAAHAKLTGLAH